MIDEIKSNLIKLKKYFTPIIKNKKFDFLIGFKSKISDE
jgi:hypothetical protein